MKHEKIMIAPQRKKYLRVKNKVIQVTEKICLSWDEDENNENGIGLTMDI